MELWEATDISLKCLLRASPWRSSPSPETPVRRATILAAAALRAHTSIPWNDYESRENSEPTGGARGPVDQPDRVGARARGTTPAPGNGLVGAGAGAAGEPR